MAEAHGSGAALGRLLGEVEALLKDRNIGMDLGRKGVNTSIALVAVQGIRAYIAGNATQASEDLLTAGEEIKARHEPG